MTGRFLLLAAASLLTPVFAAPAPAPAPAPAVEAPAAETAVEAPQFIRVEKIEHGTALQTALVHYSKGDATVDLVGAVHIADKKFYQDLNQRFQAYDALLFEGIGGGNRPAAPEPEPEPKLRDPSPEELEKAAASKGPPVGEGSAPAEDEPAVPAEKPAAAAPAPARKANLGGLHTVYQKSAQWLGLSYQMQEIDYRKANFVHADLNAEEFFAMQAERGESVVGFALKTGLRQREGKKVHEPNSYKMLASLITGDKNGLKRELVQTLGQGDDQVAGLAGENVIISERNAKCLQVLDQQVQAGRKKLGIFYGAAHFPDMEKRLLERGWKKTGAEWLTAWDIGE